MNKVAVVTGGTRGIGSAIVCALAKDGYDVVVHGRSVTDKQKAWMQELSRECNVKVKEVLCDLQDQKAIEPFFKEIKKQFGRVDILINNAGFETHNAIEDYELSDWNAIIQVNLTASFQCMQQAVRMMKEQNSSGVIINISSIHDTVPRKGVGSYCVAKAGLHMLTKVAALEFAEYGIRVVTVGPGAIETDMNKEAIDQFGRDKFNRWIPSGRIGNVTEVGDLISYLCSPKASYITGIDIHIDGGYMINTVRYDDRPGHKDIF